MKRLALMGLIFIVAVAIAFILPTEEFTDTVKIGVSDDISGFVVDYIIKEEKVDTSKDLEAYFIKDC